MMKDKNNENHQIRVGDEFYKEMENIKKQRLLLKKDKKRKSVRALTNLIVKHNSWALIQKDLIEYNFKKRETNGK